MFPSSSPTPPSNSDFNSLSLTHTHANHVLPHMVLIIHHLPPSPPQGHLVEEQPAIIADTLGGLINDAPWEQPQRQRQPILAHEPRVADENGVQELFTVDWVGIG